MGIPAVNCSPIKPQIGFGKANGENYNEVLQITDKLNDEFVNSNQIKKPVAAFASIALAALVAYVGGSKLAGVVTKMAPKAPGAVTAGIDKAGSAISKVATNLQKETPGKLGKIKNVAGKVLDKAGNLAKKGYNKIGGNIENVSEKSNTVFQNIFGVGAMATVLPGLLSKDGDENGVSDILEKGQNAYTGTKTGVAGALEKTSQFAELIDLLA